MKNVCIILIPMVSYESQLTPDVTNAFLFSLYHECMRNEH